ncbi:MAG: energy-coupling factor transporter transmembrane protein EcfT [Anaerolineae bacterium]|nr:energy-coupling factor transporter transmembrane protein EcfT [Anaerolineae bacterium]
MPSMYVQHVSRPSFFSRLDVRVKLLFMFLVSTLILIWDNIFYQGAMFAVVMALAFSSHIDRALIRKLFAVMLPFTVVMILIQGLWSPIGQTVLMTLPAWVPFIGGKLALHWEGLVFGVMVAFRLLTPIFALPLVVMTTDVNDLVVGLVRLRVPYKVAFIFSITLRFVPFIFTEIGAITEAQRLRGLAIEKMNFFRRIPIFASMLVPLILGSLLKAQTLEIVLQSKAFSGSPQRTFLNENGVKLRPVDYALLIGELIFFVGAILTRLILGWGGFVA